MKTLLSAFFGLVSCVAFAQDINMQMAHSPNVEVFFLILGEILFIQTMKIMFLQFVLKTQGKIQD